MAAEAFATGATPPPAKAEPASTAVASPDSALPAWLSVADTLAAVQAQPIYEEIARQRLDLANAGPDERDARMREVARGLPAEFAFVAVDGGELAGQWWFFAAPEGGRVVRAIRLTVSTDAPYAVSA